MDTCQIVTVVTDVLHGIIFMVIVFMGVKGVKLSTGTKKALQELLDNQTDVLQNGFTAQNKKPPD